MRQQSSSNILLVNVFTAPNMPSNLNIDMTTIPDNQIRIVWNNPLIANQPCIIAPLETHSSPVFWKSVMPDTSRVERTLGVLPGTQTVHTTSPAPQMRPHITRRMQHELLHSIMMIAMRVWIRKLGANNAVDSIDRKNPIGQNQQHVNMW